MSAGSIQFALQNGDDTNPYNLDDHPELEPSEVNTEFSADINPTFSVAARDIRTKSRSLRNRLRSIYQDGLFVREAANCPGFNTEGWKIPVVANRRAGEWYVRNDGEWYDYAGSCYFKSTDGHFGSWGVSRRRLNLNVLEAVKRGRERGVIIVDSTRRGKRFPDSLSKTVPIWLTTLNHLFFPATAHKLYTPPHAVSATEWSQITSLLPSFVSELQSLGIKWSTLPYKPSKPLRPIFITPESHLPQDPWDYEELEFIPVILLMASRMVRGEGIEGEYVQGAGDDAENWLKEGRLTPGLFWKYHKELLGVNTNEELQVKIEECLVRNELQGDNTENHRMAASGSLLNCKLSGTDAVSIKPADSLGVLRTDIDNLCWDRLSNHHALIRFTAAAECSTSSTGNPTASSPCILTIPIPTSLLPSGNTKRSSKLLRTDILPTVQSFITALPTLAKNNTKKMLVIWPMDKYGGDVMRDIVCASVLLVCCLLFDEHGNGYGEGVEKPVINKEYIRRRLTWIITSLATGVGEVNVSRASLLAVNSVLMS